MNLPAALAHLAAAGITPDVLAAEGVDPADPAALLAFVDEMLSAVLAEYVLVDRARAVALEAARELLLPDDEHVWRERFAARLRADLEAQYDMPACSWAA